MKARIILPLAGQLEFVYLFKFQFPFPQFKFLFFLIRQDKTFLFIMLPVQFLGTKSRRAN